MRTRSTPGAILRLAQPELLTAVSLAWLWRMWPSSFAPASISYGVLMDRPWFSAVEKVKLEFHGVEQGQCDDFRAFRPDGVTRSTGQLASEKPRRLSRALISQARQAWAASVATRS